MTDYTDLARWLKAEGDAHFAGNVRDRRTVAAKMHEAADAIAALQAEVARLRDGMEWISRRVPDGMPLLEAVKDRPAEVAHDAIACARYHARGQAEVARLREQPREGG